jgi:hypothetical protein
MTVRIDEAWDDPPAGKYGLGVDHGLGAQDSIGNPPLDRLTVGQAAPPQMEAHG